MRSCARDDRRQQDRGHLRGQRQQRLEELLRQRFARGGFERARQRRCVGRQQRQVRHRRQGLGKIRQRGTIARRGAGGGARRLRAKLGRRKCEHFSRSRLRARVIAARKQALRQREPRREELRVDLRGATPGVDRLVAQSQLPKHFAEMEARIDIPRVGARGAPKIQHGLDRPARPHMGPPALQQIGVIAGRHQPR